MKIETVPHAFPNKGKYRTWDSAWSPTGYADTPQYPGQQPVRFPADWTSLDCFFGRRVAP